MATGASNAKPLTSIDVAAHEMSHGVTENTAGLNYSGDAGGLNEATSDIFGTRRVLRQQHGRRRLPHRREDRHQRQRHPLRYMDKPSKDGRSQDCWTTAHSRLDPHYSSGPLNHWFYLASEGSGAKTINGVSYNSPTCNGSTVTGTAGTGSPRSGTARWPRSSRRAAPTPARATAPSPRPRSSTRRRRNQLRRRGEGLQRDLRPRGDRGLQHDPARRPRAATCCRTPVSSPAR